MSENFKPAYVQFYARTPLEKRETTSIEQRILTEITYREELDMEIETYEEGVVLNYEELQKQLGEGKYEPEGAEHLIVSDSESGLRATIEAHLEENRSNPLTSDDWSNPLGTGSSY